MIRVKNYNGVYHETFQFNNGLLVVVVDSLSGQYADAYFNGKYYHKVNVPFSTNHVVTANRVNNIFKNGTT